MGRSGEVRGVDKEARQLRALMRMVGVQVSRDPKKIYGTAIRLLHNEERAYARITHGGGRFNRAFTQLVTKYGTFRYPAIFNDYNRTTTSDNKTLLGIHAANRRILKNIRRRYSHKGWRVRRREYLKGLVQDMMLRTAGNRVRYNSSEKTALETARGAKADCTELSRYAFARLRLAGFRPELVFVQNSGENTLLVGKTMLSLHVLVAVKDPANAREYFYIDLKNDGIVSEPQHKRFGSPRTLMSIYHQSKGIYYEELRDDLVTFIGHNRKGLDSSALGRMILGVTTFFRDASEALALQHYNRAIYHDSNSGPAFYSKAFLLWSTNKRLSEARVLAATALRFMPNYKDAKRLLVILMRD